MYEFTFFNTFHSVIQLTLQTAVSRFIGIGILNFATINIFDLTVLINVKGLMIDVTLVQRNINYSCSID